MYIHEPGMVGNLIGISFFPFLTEVYLPPPFLFSWLGISMPVCCMSKSMPVCMHKANPRAVKSPKCINPKYTNPDHVIIPNFSFPNGFDSMDTIYKGCILDQGDLVKKRAGLMYSGNQRFGKHVVWDWCIRDKNIVPRKGHALPFLYCRNTLTKGKN